MTTHLQTLRALFTELMGWTDEALLPVDFVMASYLSAFLPGSVQRAWGELCGPPSIGKTEILNSLEDGGKRTVAVDHLTENSLASAMQDPDQPDKDFSLLYQLSSNREPRGPKVMVVRDWSTISQMRRDKMEELLAGLRTAFDGKHSTAAGNIGMKVRDDLQFGLILAGTEDLDEFRRTHQTLGERTLVCRLGRETRDYEARQALTDRAEHEDRIKKAAIQARIRVTVRKALDQAIAHIKVKGGKVGRPNGLAHRVGRLAAVATSVRTGPMSSGGYKALAEGPHRFRNQLLAWGDCRVLFDSRDSWTNDDYNMVRRIAQDTMPPESLAALHAIWRGSIEKATQPISLDAVRQAALADQSIYRQLRQWAIIGILGMINDNTVGMREAFAKDVEYTGFMEGFHV